jgi:hypothetical protein
MGLRRIADETDARRCLMAVARAGGDLGAWTRAHGVDGRSLNLWKVNLERRSHPRGRPRRQTAALSVVELVPRQQSRLARSARYVLEVESGARIEVGDDFEEETLRRLLGVLRSC